MRRNDLDICADILNVAQSGARKTQIVYQANLNFRTVNPYLDRLVKNGFLDVKKDTKVLYETIDKGTELLETLENIEYTLE